MLSDSDETPSGVEVGYERISEVRDLCLCLADIDMLGEQSVDLGAEYF